MSEENVEVVRRAVYAFNAQDTERLLSMCDPAIEFRSAVEQKTFVGLTSWCGTGRAWLP